MERGFRNRSSQQPGNDPDLEGKLKKIAKLNGIQQKRSHIAKEILTTERSYVHNLETCLKNHVKVLSEPGSIVGPDIASALFGNMEEVYLLNSGFLFVPFSSSSFFRRSSVSYLLPLFAGWHSRNT